jgi:ABC-type glutathione transport system ATPase component
MSCPEAHTHASVESPRPDRIGSASHLGLLGGTGGKVSPLKSGAVALLVFRGVSKCYPDGLREVVVLDGVSFEVMAGEFVGLWGVERSGKSTLLRIAAGWSCRMEVRSVLRGMSCRGFPLLSGRGECVMGLGLQLGAVGIATVWCLIMSRFL